MTVDELIEALKKYPGEMRIFMTNDHIEAYEPEFNEYGISVDSKEGYRVEWPILPKKGHIKSLVIG